MPFSKLGLSPTLVAPLARMGYGEPTPVQLESIPLVLTGNDLLARAQTGTGKTAAFGLPMIERLMIQGRRPRTSKPLGLVLVPTRELAIQVHKSLLTYGAPVRLRVAAIVGGMSMVNQIRALRMGTDIVVATPGTLDRSPAAAHGGSVGGGDPDAGRRGSDARHGLPAGAEADRADAAEGTPDAAVLGDDVEADRGAVGRVHQEPEARRHLERRRGRLDDHASRASRRGRSQA